MKGLEEETEKKNIEMKKSSKDRNCEGRGQKNHKKTREESCG